jgi:hypothetical protein
MARMCIVAAYYNFSKTHSSLTLSAENIKIKRTPAMAAKPIDRIWSLDEILARPIS